MMIRIRRRADIMSITTDQDQKFAIIGSLEKILFELDEQRLYLPALKIVEALEILGSPAARNILPDC